MVDCRRMALTGRWIVLGLLLAVARGPEIQDLSIMASGGQVLVSFRFVDAMTPEVRERIDSGLPTSFIYELELMRDRKHWWDRGLQASRIEVVTMYNAVTHEYLVNTKHDGRLIGSQTVRDPADLERDMTEFVSFPAFVVDAEGDPGRFLVRARAELGLGAMLGFIPYQRSTGWLESNKIRLVPRLP